jgi:hypothetical protein
MIWELHSIPNSACDENYKAVVNIGDTERPTTELRNGAQNVLNTTEAIFNGRNRS